MPTLEDNARLKAMEQDLLNNYTIGNGFGGSGVKNTMNLMNVPKTDSGKLFGVSIMPDPRTGTIKTKSPNDTAIRMDDFAPHGEEVTMWGGLKLSTTGGIASLVQGFLSDKKAKKSKLGFLNYITSTKASLDKSGLSKTGTQLTDMINNPAIQNVLNDPETEAMRVANNETMIQSGFPFVGGLTSQLFDQQKMMVINGKTFYGIETKPMEKVGLSLAGCWKDIPDSIQVRISWGKAFTKALTSPEIIGAALNLFGEEPIMQEIMQYAAMGLEILPIAQEVLSPEFDKYAAALKIAYGMLDEEDKQIIGLYKYYKTAMINYNDPIMNPDGTQWNLGREISDSFFGSINYNVTNFVKGGVDYISETWQNISLEGASFVRDSFNEFNNFSQAFESATGIKLQLDPKFEQGVYDTMEKLGFGQPGIGIDTQAYIQNALITKTTCLINDNIFVDFNNVLSYHEIFDFRNSKFAKRRILIRLSAEELSRLKFDDDVNNKITVNRKYGFALGQHPKGTLPYNYNTEFTEYDEIKDFKFKLIKDSIQGDREALKKIGQKTAEKSALYPHGLAKNNKSMVYQDIWLELYPDKLLEAENGIPINGIPSDVPASTLILQGFQTSIDEHFKIVMQEPKNDVVLKDVAIPPQTFNQLVNSLQKDYGIYEGGVNIFVDRDIFYVLPKEGLTDFEVDKQHIDGSWEFEFRVRQIETEPNPEMLVFIIPSRRKIIWPLTEADISSPTESTEFKTIVNPYSKGSTLGLTQGTTGQALGQVIEPQQHSYMTPKPVENKKYYNIFLKIPHTFTRFTPGDKITIKWRNETYVGDVRKWASQQHNNERRVIVDAICEIAPEKQNLVDKLSPGNWIEKLQEKAAEFNARFESTMVDWSNKTGDWIQEKLQYFHQNIESPRIYEALQIIEEDFEVPGYNIDYMKNYDGTYAMEELERYGMGNRYIDGVGSSYSLNGLYSGDLFKEDMQQITNSSIWSTANKQTAQPPAVSTKNTKK